MNKPTQTKDIKNVLTLATGKQLYTDLAVNLARSFYLWNKEAGINFYIGTDNASHIPNDVLAYAKVISINKGELGEGFSTKLHLDKIAPEGKTLFIDSDCLIFGNLSFVFKEFSGKHVSVLGDYIHDGEWFGNISSILSKYKLLRMPKFNGGIYYIEKGETASKVYKTARKLEKQYDEIGFVRLRSRPNDEVLMALAMELHEQKPISDDGTIMGDLQSCQGDYSFNIITGERRLTNPPVPHPKHQAWYPFTEVKPLIIHFLGAFTNDYPYQREALYLQKFKNDKLNLRWRAYAKICIVYPAILKKVMKNTFRPIYRALFGFRNIKQSERI